MLSIQPNLSAMSEKRAKYLETKTGKKKSQQKQTNKYSSTPKLSNIDIKITDCNVQKYRWQMKNFTRNTIYEKKVSNGNSGSEIYNNWINNSTEVFDRLDRAEELISKPENRSVENSQSESTEENKKENTEKTARVIQCSEISHTYN